MTSSRGRGCALSKLARLTLKGGANALESMGAGRSSGPRPEAPGVANGAFKRLEGTTRSAEFLKIRLDRIARDESQPRKEFDPEKLQSLADSMDIFGQLQAIRAWYDPEPDCYRLVAGERRWRAAKLIGLAELLCQVVPRPDSDPLRLAAQIAENTARADLAGRAGRRRRPAPRPPQLDGPGDRPADGPVEVFGRRRPGPLVDPGRSQADGRRRPDLAGRRAGAVPAAVAGGPGRARAGCGLVQEIGRGGSVFRRRRPRTHRICRICVQALDTDRPTAISIPTRPTPAR